MLTIIIHPAMVIRESGPERELIHRYRQEDVMKKLLWMTVFLCLGPMLVSAALAGRTDRLCVDFDSRTARVKERIAWNEKMLYDDLGGIKQDRARTQRNPRLSLADEKLSLAMRLCNDALSQVQILKARVPREIDCGDRHRTVRREIDAEVVALNDVESKLSNLSIIVNQYRQLRLEAAAIIESAGGGSRY
jgi:hypothetical protein